MTFRCLSFSSVAAWSRQRSALLRAVVINCLAAVRGWSNFRVASRSTSTSPSTARSGLANPADGSPRRLALEADGEIIKKEKELAQKYRG